MKKHGFTLIELLAVIIILAIIALIATPIVMRITEGVKESANERSIYNYIREVNTKIVAAKISGPIVVDNTYSVESDGNICLNPPECSSVLTIEMKGTKPSDGSIEIEGSKVVSASGLKLNDKYYDYANGIVSLSSSQSISHDPGAMLTDGSFKSWDDLVNDGSISIEGSTLSSISNTNIKSLVIPDSVSSLELNIFENLDSIESITIPSSISSIPPNAFLNTTNLKLLVLEGMPNINKPNFVGCDSLESIIIKEGVTEIIYDAFRDITSLTSVTIPEGVTSIGDGAFSGTNLTSVTIPNSVTSIGSSAFSGTNLTSVTIPNSVTSIGSGAFSGTNLTSVTIPRSVTSIGSQAFSYCASLSAITVASDNTVYEDRNSNAIFLKNGDTVLAGCKGTVIPSSVTSIGEYAFRGSGLTSITIPSTITSIGSGAFMDCTSLTSVTIQEGATSIGTSVFKGCTNLGPITIPASVTSIGKSVFEGCNTSVLTAIEFTSTTGWKSRTTGSWTAVDLSVPENNVTKFTSTSGVKKQWQVFES